MSGRIAAAADGLFLGGALLLLPGCASNGPNQLAGAAAGGAAGGLLGSMFGGGTGRLAGVAIGATVGTVLGSSLGASLDRGAAHGLAKPLHVPTPGEEAAHARGRAELLQEQQAMREQEAYRRGRSGIPLR
jgi:hypothetical protein